MRWLWRLSAFAIWKYCTVATVPAVTTTAVASPIARSCGLFMELEFPLA